jgi:hypothetical protein
MTKNENIVLDSFQPHSLIPNNIQSQSICILETILLAHSLPIGWDESDIHFNIGLEFFTPSNEILKYQNMMNEMFTNSGKLSTPRFALKGFRVNPLDDYRYRGITIDTDVTDWAIVHGLQSALNKDDETDVSIKLSKSFWDSVHSLTTNHQRDNFPHHISIHCLVVSSDNKIILNKRRGVENQQGRISASFEEQMQFPFIYPPINGGATRYKSGDQTPFDAIVRGAKEELNIDLQKNDIKILGVAMESASVAFNIISIAKSDLSADEIYGKWKLAEDREENLMVPAIYTLEWNAELFSKIPLNGFKANDEGKIYNGSWHASSVARIYLGLIYEFGNENIFQPISNMPLDTNTINERESHFGVFLCHNSQDKPFIRIIANELKERKITTWLDEEQLPPGMPWQDELEGQINKINSVAVFVGRNGLGPWQQNEIRAFLSEFIGRGCPVIPVILPDAQTIPELPIFLKQRTWVDLRKDFQDGLAKIASVAK